MPTTGISGKIALVTGAANGIGAAVTSALLAEGARVAALDLEPIPERPAARTPQGEAMLVAKAVDVRSASSVDETVDAVEREIGPISIVVNVAGVVSSAAIVDTSDDQWQSVFDVNTKGVFNVTRAVLRRMIRRREGVLVTVSSNAAAIPRKNMAAYAASKAAATMFTRCAGLEAAEFGVRCNIVAPGSTLTRMQAAAFGGADGALDVVRGSLDQFRTGIPLGKLAEPQNVADAVVFLVSDQASHITMADIFVDGGATLNV